jgi:flagellin
MGLQINTNVTALDALRNLTNVSANVANSVQKLSSGLRINSAADDPAGLIISQSLQAQIGGTNQAISNAQDATNVIKTADGALSQVNTLLDNIRQLAVHASNTGVNDQIAVQADQTQIASALASIDRIATQTQFGTKHLLDGTSGTTASVVDTTDIAGISIGGVFGGVSTQNGTVNVAVNNVATRAQVSGAGLATYASINASISTVNGGKTGAGGTVVINGQSIGISGSDTVQTVINKINNLAGTTGVSANFTSANGSGAIVLTQQNYGANFQINESESSTLLAGTAGTLVKGQNATVTVIASGLVNGVSTSIVATFTGGRSATDSGLKVTDTLGNSILLNEAFLSTYTAGGGAQKTIGTVTSGSLQFQIGANAGQYVSASLGNVRTAQLGNTTVAGSNLSLLDVTTAQGAQNAITQTDEAISQVSQLRANLGAFQSQTLQSTIQYLGVTSENLSASASQITDTNVAQEVVNLTKNQIIQQAATSVLAQANSAPNQILRLLQ